MKIEQIDIYRVALPFDAGRSELPDAPETEGDAFNAASRSLREMESLMVRLRTDSGLEGWGEAFGHLINPVTYAALSGSVGKFFLGAEVSFDEAGFPILTTEALRAFHGFGATGPVLYALSALDTALWDLAARGKDLPLHEMLGSHRNAIRCYASLVSYDNDPGQVAKHVSRATSRGFDSIKLHETEPAAVLAARRAMADHQRLMVDVNCAWTGEQAQSMLQQMGPADLGWIEEPTWPPGDLAALKKVRDLGIPVAAGENASGIQGFIQHFHAHAIDVAQPSVAKIGGISGMLEVMRHARRHSVEIVPHCFYFGPGLCATAQIVASLRDDIALEVPFLDWPEPLHPMQSPQASRTLPDAAGIGFEPDWNTLTKHLVASKTLSIHD